MGNYTVDKPIKLTLKKLNNDINSNNKNTINLF